MTWKKLCRACLTTNDCFTYYLFHNVSPETYLFCTSIQANENEELPKTLCNNCYNLLIKYSEFKRTCIESQNTLLNCVHTVKDETLSVINLKKEITGDEQKAEIETFEIEFTVKEEDSTEDFNSEYILPTVPDTDSVLNQDLKSKRKKKIQRRTKQHGPKQDVGTELSSRQFKYSCEMCDKKFRYLERFEAHKMEHEGKRMSLQCAPCKKTFLTWSGLKRHEDSTHSLVSLDSVSCRVCGRVCKTKQTLRAHEKSHRPRSPCMCHVCGRSVTTPVILKAHLETHQVRRDRCHTCEHCGKKFFTNTILLSHISRQHTGRRYVCEICSFPFKDKYNLSKHLLLHDGKKSFKCDICAKSYATNGSLIEHKRIHSGERPFPCNYCPKKFLSKRRLTDHHRIHTGEKRHKCAVCEQRFTQRGTLQRHMKVHEKIIPTLN